MYRVWLASLVPAFFVAAIAQAQTPPPAPVLLAPAAGAAVVEPVTLQWAPVVDPDGPIGSYTWQVSGSSTFATIVASGFTNVSDIPAATQDRVSGLPLGTWFWRVMAKQIVGGVLFSLDSPWSAVRTFTVTGLGNAPAAPTVLQPGNGTSFHVTEFFDITWSSVPGAHHYLLEADDEPAFSYPLTLTTDLVQFGNKFNAGWGNALASVFYRVRAVSADGVCSLPSATLTVHITNNAPVPPAPVPLSPVGGATITIPFTFDWTDTANPQIIGYDLDIDDEPQFLGAVGVLLVQGVSRSDYMVVPDPLVEGINHFPPGQYFWRVRALHGDAFGPWSAGATFNVAASPPTPPGLALFTLIVDPGSTSGGNSTQARVTLNMPAPAGGALIKIASDLPHAQTPVSVLIPAGATDAIVSPITTLPVHGATVGTIRAAYGLGWQQSSIGMFPILWGLSLSNEGVVGGTSVTGTATLLNPAPPGGVTITLLSTDPALASCPATLFVPAGGFGGTFTVTTAPVTAATRVVFQSGTAFEGYRAPDTWLMLLPAGSPEPAASLASLTLGSSIVPGSGTTKGTVTLTAPAPAGGALVRLNGSMEGQVVTPQNVTVPAGGTFASFDINAPQVNFKSFVLVQASYGTSGGSQAKLLEIDPAPTGVSTLLAFGVSPLDVQGGSTTRGTVELVVPAPAGGGSVTLTSSDPAHAQVPATVAVAAGNSVGSFTITTSPVQVLTTVRIDASAGGVTRSAFLNLAPDPNAALALLSVTLSVSGVTGGNGTTGTLFLNGNAPAGGVTVTLATSTLVAQVPPIVAVPAGLGFASFTVTTSPVTTSTAVTITGFLGTSQKSAVLTVLPGATQPPAPAAPSLVSPADSATPAQPVTLSWNSVANATSYDVQVDDSSAFSAPLVRSLTVSTTSTTVSGLSTVRHFWRVRARNSAGVAGSFSASRRFTPQGAPAPVSLTAVSASPSAPTGGNSAQGTVTLSSGAPTGALVTLSSNSAAASVPASVTVAVGATSATFAVATTAVTTATAVTITASWNGTTRTTLVTVSPPPVVDTTPPTVSIAGPAAAATVGGTVAISATAADNVGVARVEFLVDGTLLSSDATAPYSASWNTTTASNGAHQLTARAFDAANNATLSTAVAVTVDNGAAPVVTFTSSGVPATIARGQTFLVRASVTNTGATSATGLSVVIAFTPTDSMRLETPQTATQSVATVPGGGTQSVAWTVRADRAASASLTLTLRNASGATVATRPQTLTILN